jgi:hypothetical protein
MALIEHQVKLIEPQVLVSFARHGRSQGQSFPYGRAMACPYAASRWKCDDDRLDSRFRGNDRCFEGDPIPKDTGPSHTVSGRWSAFGRPLGCA